MKILIVGNLGYVGPPLVRHLRRQYPNCELVGFDSAWFAHCLTSLGPYPEILLDSQIYGDIRNIPNELVDGTDIVIYLAAVSNDPMGNSFERVTGEINHLACVNLAKLSAKFGVKNFVFASSCSVYGSTGDEPKKESDELNPLTAYAKSKILAEKNLAEIGAEKMIITCLRFATACGMSDRLRLDLVLNDFVACALSQKMITVLSDGSPWRPLIHVDDMARAIEWASFRLAENGGNFVVVNAGANEWNYQVKDLAQAVAELVPGVDVIINQNSLPDKRSYRVDFSLFKRLAIKHQPMVTLTKSIAGLIDGLNEIKFEDKNFRESQLIRLNVLNRFIESGNLTENLSWAKR